MFINITIEKNGVSLDIKIDSEQKIRDGLTVLQESGKLSEGDIPDFFKSRLQERPVSTFKTFHEEQIFDGDILSVIS